MKKTILLIEDDENVRATIADLLCEDGYDVATVSTAEKALRMIGENTYDAILLDIQLPDENGLNLIATFRKTTKAPIIILSGRTDTVDKIIGLEMGADDYIAKPPAFKELSARIKAQIRRHKDLTDKTPASKIAFENFVLDRNQMQVFAPDGKNIGLTAREYRLVEALVMAPRQVQTREQLLNKVRSDNLDITDRAVDVQLLRIRKKMNDNTVSQRIIKAIRGVGYMLDCYPKAINE